MSFLHFRLLMWKNYQLKMYHIYVTLFEFILPILFNFFAMQLWSPDQQHPLKVIESFPMINYTNNISHIKMEICYSPSNSITTDFMKRLETDKSLNITSLSDEKELELYIQNSTKDNLVGVHFRNLASNTSSSNKFSYILRQLMAEEMENDYFTKVQLLLNENFIDYVSPGQEKMLEKLNIQQSMIIVPSAKIDVWVPHYIVYFLIWMFSIAFMADILEEKNNGTKEWMKIIGVKESTIRLTWYFHGASIMLISLTLSAFLLKGYLGKYLRHSAYNYVPFIVLWLFWIFYCVANISFCFMLSSIFHSTAVVTLLFAIYIILVAFGYSYIIPYVPPYCLCLIPHISFWFGYREMYEIEYNRIKFDWSVFSNPQNKQLALPFGLRYIFCMLIVDTLLYLLLAVYIENVNPGKFGTPKPLFFLCQDIFSRNRKNEDLSMSRPMDEMDPRYFEPPPSNLTPAVEIVDLHKRFRSLHAVRGVNLVTYKGEITALLGHNGAGKTTTLSILTGLIPPSSGDVYYNGMNAFKNMNKFRLLIGLCPQENRTFPYLSVMQHLLFFGRLKGASKKEAKKEAEEYLEIVDMESKKNSEVSELSGGMKRKLCLCIALMGKAEELREGRSLILTTHYMEEADALGDRIAIMNHGVIVCYGSSMFLKKAYETGYKLTITKSSDNSDAITQLVQSTLPSASVISDAEQEVVYKLPLTETHRFPALFRSLEYAMMRLGIENMGVTATTMEQVFLIAGDVGASDSNSSKTIINNDDYVIITGPRLLFQQLLALFKKKILFTTRDLPNLFNRLVLPTLIACLVLYVNDVPWKSPDSTVDLLFSTIPAGGIVLFDSVNNTPPGLEIQLRKYVTEKNGLFIKGNGSGLDIALFSLASKKYEDYLNHFTLGIGVKKLRTRLMYSQCKHCKPIAIDVYSNVFLRNTTNSDQYSIETTYQPVPNLNPNSTRLGCIPPKETGFQSNSILFSLAFTTVDWLTYFAQFVSMEQMDGFYQIQMMSRVSPIIYRLGTLLFDFVLFSIAMIIRMVLYKLIVSMDIIGFHEAFYVYLLITTLFGISGLLFIYIMAFLIDFRNRSAWTFLIFNVFCVINVVVYNFVPNALFMLLLMTIIPFFTYYRLYFLLTEKFSKNSICSYCIESYKSMCEDEMKKNKFAYFESLSKKPYGMSSFLLRISGQIVAYSLILLLIDMKILGRLNILLSNWIFGAKSPLKDAVDSDVEEERDRVEKFRNDMSSSEGSEKISLLVDGLHKDYVASVSKTSSAVSDVSFVADRGTCFGLLGVNGAGKTTTFKMLTAEIVPTAGDAQIDGYKLIKNQSEYLKLAGYCAQNNCFIEQLTGLEMLTMIASMKGVRGRDRNELVDKWLTIMGLEEYKNRRCGSYSGGNKRKLCTVMSLIGNPRVVFLDEPTSGVDPVARRNLYDVMAQSRSAGQTVVLTSHSMDECETLCDRLTIMVSGVMKCIGSVQHLKKRYAQGFSAMVKIFDTPEAREEIPELKEAIVETFDSSYITLKDERIGLLYYQITDTSLLWSALFEMMERIKSQFQDVVQDYVITDTSLEEVFISFAKNQ